MKRIRRRLVASPELLPLRLDEARRAALFVHLSEAEYRAASFLDERVTLTSPPFGWVDYADIAAAAAHLPDGGGDFIFHIGHVGSTLLSRVLGEHPAIFSLREPAVLRALTVSAAAAGDAEAGLPALLRLLSRTWRRPQRALIKATSFVSELGVAMMDQARDARAILLFATPSSYLATILAGPASRQELRAAAPLRLQQLHRRIGREAWRLEDLSEGECAAMAWAAGACALAAIAARFPDRILWLDFDAALRDLRVALSACLNHLHGEASQAAVAALAASGHLSRYAKAPEHAYDAALRESVLDAARREHALELRRAADWLNAACADHATIATAARAAAASRR